MDIYSAIIIGSAIIAFAPTENLKIILKIIKEVGKIIGS